MNFELTLGILLGRIMPKNFVLQFTDNSYGFYEWITSPQVKRFLLAALTPDGQPAYSAEAVEKIRQSVSSAYDELIATFPEYSDEFDAQFIEYTKQSSTMNALAFVNTRIEKAREIEKEDYEAQIRANTEAEASLAEAYRRLKEKDDRIVEILLGNYSLTESLKNYEKKLVNNKKVNTQLRSDIKILKNMIAAGPKRPPSVPSYWEVLHPKEKKKIGFQQKRKCRLIGIYDVTVEQGQTEIPLSISGTALLLRKDYKLITVNFTYQALESLLRSTEPGAVKLKGFKAGLLSCIYNRVIFPDKNDEPVILGLVLGFLPEEEALRYSPLDVADLSKAVGLGFEGYFSEDLVACNKVGAIYHSEGKAKIAIVTTKGWITNTFL